MDLAPIQPAYVPLNCEFMVGDLTENLEDFNDGSMDLVHSRCSIDYSTMLIVLRFVQLGIQKEQWSGYINEVFRILKPGTGYIQCAEVEGHRFENDIIPPDCALPKVLSYQFRVVF